MKLLRAYVPDGKSPMWPKVHGENHGACYDRDPPHFSEVPHFQSFKTSPKKRFEEK